MDQHTRQEFSFGFSFGFSSGKASAKPATRVKIVIKNFILSAIRLLGWKRCSIRLVSAGRGNRLSLYYFACREERWYSWVVLCIYIDEQGTGKYSFCLEGDMRHILRTSTSISLNCRLKHEGPRCRSTSGIISSPLPKPSDMLSRQICVRLRAQVPCEGNRWSVVQPPNSCRSSACSIDGEQCIGLNLEQSRSVVQSCAKCSCILA